MAPGISKHLVKQRMRRQTLTFCVSLLGQNPSILDQTGSEPFCFPQGQDSKVLQVEGWRSQFLDQTQTMIQGILLLSPGLAHLEHLAIMCCLFYLTQEFTLITITAVYTGTLPRYGVCRSLRSSKQFCSHITNTEKLKERFYSQTINNSSTRTPSLIYII